LFAIYFLFYAPDMFDISLLFSPMITLSRMRRAAPRRRHDIYDAAFDAAMPRIIRAAITMPRLRTPRRSQILRPIARYAAPPQLMMPADIISPFSDAPDTADRCDAAARCYMSMMDLYLLSFRCRAAEAFMLRRHVCAAFAAAAAQMPISARRQPLHKARRDALRQRYATRWAR
jgi:hypothetical protein